MPNVCVHFQPDRAMGCASAVRQALQSALPDGERVVGDDDGQYEDFLFDVDSPQEAMSKLQAVFDAPQVGRWARHACIVTCEGIQGWDDYLLLHHYDRSLVCDA